MSNLDESVNIALNIVSELYNRTISLPLRNPNMSFMLEEVENEMKKVEALFAGTSIGSLALSSHVKKRYDTVRSAVYALNRRVESYWNGEDDEEDRGTVIFYRR